MSDPLRRRADLGYRRRRPSPKARAIACGGLAAVLRAQLVAHRQGVASPAATTGEDLASGLRLHSGPEAVILQPLASTWIPERRLHYLLARASGLVPRSFDRKPLRVGAIRRAVNQFDALSSSGFEASRD